MNFNNLRNSEKSLIMRNNYKRWKLDALDEAGYFVIFQGFLEGNKLKEISGNALKLYIYLGLNSNNLEGIVWHSNRKIAEYFDRSERTIRCWMKELERYRLIRRMRLKYDEKVYTYLQPYIYKYESKDNVDDNMFELIEGNLKIDEIGGLYIQGKHTYIPVINSMNMEVWNEKRNKWVGGKMDMIRITDYFSENQDKKVCYIFKSRDNSMAFRIDSVDDTKKTEIKVRVMLTVYGMDL